MTARAGNAGRFDPGTRSAVVSIVVLAIAASITGVTNGFALDDIPIIATNDAVHSLGNVRDLLTQMYWPPAYGQSLYRPFTTIAFSLQWAIGGGSPLPFHIVNIALYVAICLSVLRLGRQVMPPRAAFIGSAIFAVHPLHVEAVANVVGQAELWTALLMLVALSMYLDARKANRVSIRDATVMSALYAAALMFKEHAIVLPAMIVAAEVILHRSQRVSERLRLLAPVVIGMMVTAVAFVTLRTSVIGMFTGGSTATVFRDQDYQGRFLTMLNILPEWLRLFFWPADLSADYSPPRIVAATELEPSMIPGVIVLAAVCAIAVRLRRDHPGFTFALAVMGIALLIPSNLIIVTGFVLAERALFLATIGFALALGYAIAAAIALAAEAAPRRTVVAATMALIVAGTARSATRSSVWKDNETLFRQTVRDVPRSYRAHLMLGELLTDRGNNPEGLPELAMAVSLSNPKDYFVRWFAADRHHAAGKLEAATRFYKEALALKPSDSTVRYGTAMALLSLGQRTEARDVAREGIDRNPSDVRFERIVRDIDGSALRAGGE